MNSFLASPADAAAEERFPLDVDRCQACSHVQLGLLLEPEDVFGEYLYFSGYADAVIAHGRALAERYRELLGPDVLVAELASNDGAILSAFRSRAKILGIDPAKNVARVANERGVPTLPLYFGRNVVPELIAEHGRPRLILARNVLAHVPDLLGFVGGVADWLEPGGVFHVEVPYLVPLLESTAFDTIYHEHLSYFSLRVAAELMRRGGLELTGAEEIPLHGGSLLLSASHPGARPCSAAVGALLAREEAAGLDGPGPYRELARRVDRLRVELPQLLRELRGGGGRVAAYGAAAKGVVLSNTCGLGPDLLDFVADRSPHKQGRLMPGTHVPVVAPERVLADMPGHLLVLAWNFFDEIARQLAPYAAAGGKFVLPVPSPRVVRP